MDKKKVLSLEIIVLILSILLSFVFHELYGWAGQNSIVGAIAPINESVWEHGKIIFFPYLILSLIEMLILKPNDKINFLAVKFLASIVGVIAMTIFFYTYSGLWGDHSLVMDIISGIFGLVAAAYVSYSFLSENKEVKFKHIINILGVSLIVLYVIFNYYPPNIDWFISSV